MSNIVKYDPTLVGIDQERKCTYIIYEGVKFVPESEIKRLEKAVELMREIVLMQPRYAENNQQEVIERDSWIRAMKKLAEVDSILKGAE